MTNIVTVPKVVMGSNAGANTIRPDTTATNWTVIEERETEFVIEIVVETE